jgi:hypothetical protein
VAVLLVVYWLATLVVVHFTWAGGIPDPVVALPFTAPLIAGFVVGHWRAWTPERAAGSDDVMRGGTLAGVLSAVMTLVVMKGGSVDEVIGWTRGWEFSGQWGEVLEVTIAAAVLGAVLGLVGAALAVVVDHRRRLGRRSLPT